MNRLFLVFLLLLPNYLYSAHSHSGPEENIGGFIAGTKVQTISGPDYIQNIRINDRVVSFDFNKNKIVDSKVIDVQQVQVDSLVRLELNGEEIYTNPDHRFYCPLSETWVAARDLEVNKSVLLSTESKTFKIEKKNIIYGRAILYELTIEDTHNYFVSNHLVLVHNFVVVIPIATWVIGEGIFWASAATIATAIGLGLAVEHFSRQSNAPTNCFREIGDTIDLEDFSERQRRSGQTGVLRNPKTGEYLEQDSGLNSGNRPHGGGHWKLYGRDGKRRGTVDDQGKILRK